MYLQLAENLAETEDEINPYILIPDPTGQKQGIYVREDLFDGMPNIKFNQMMREIAPWQASVQAGMSESMFLADRASRKAKREEKDKARQEKKNLKNEKKKAKVAIKNAKAEGKAGKAGRGGKIIDSIGGIIGGLVGGKVPDAPDEEIDNSPDPEPEKKSNTGMYIGIAAAAVAVIGIGVAVSRSRSRVPTV